MESRTKPCMPADGWKNNCMYWTEIFFILFILFCKGIYWFYYLGQVKSVDSVSLSQSLVNSQHYNRLCSAVKRQIKENTFTLYSAIRAGSQLLLRMTNSRRKSRKRMMVTAVDSQCLCQLHTHNQIQTHTPFPSDGCVASVCCSLICTLYQCNQLWE